MLSLRVRPPGGQGYVVSLKTFPVRIGRSPASDLRLDDPFASRLHTDTPVHPGDRVRLGNSVLEIESFEADATVSTGRPADDRTLTVLRRTP